MKNPKYAAQYKYKEKMKSNPEYKEKQKTYVKNWLKRNTSNINVRYSKQKTRAKRENRKFNIPLDKYRNMIEAGCYYCGTDLTTAKGGSLDRKNNNNPNYTVQNVVACCTDCNNLKNYQLTVDETKYVVKQLKSYRKKHGNKKIINRNSAIRKNKQRKVKYAKK